MLFSTCQNQLNFMKSQQNWVIQTPSVALGVQQNYSKAFDHFEKSAKLGKTYALRNLGICYREDQGVEQNYSKMIEYYEKLA